MKKISDIFAAGWVQGAIPPALLALLIIVIEIGSPGFLTGETLGLLLGNTAVLFILATGVTFVILIGGFLVAFGALFTEFTFHPPVWVTLIVWLPMTLVVCLGLLRPFKGVMLAAQFMNDAAEARHD